MAGQDLHDPGKALEYKEKGNKCFQAGDYNGAQALYTKAINLDSSNPLLYTNRAMSSLKLADWNSVITDSVHAISLLPENMKAYYYLAQAEISLSRPQQALESAKLAHKFCVGDIEKSLRDGSGGSGGKSAGSLGPITELVLRCKKEDWERRERERTSGRNSLLDELTTDLKAKMERDIAELKQSGSVDVELEIREREMEFNNKTEVLKRTFEQAREAGSVERRRKVPDWVLDDITFGVMLDPVVTKTGQSYDRASIMEHLKRSPTDPLTREPMTATDLRPNLALKEACEGFLAENGWAVDW